VADVENVVRRSIIVGRLCRRDRPIACSLGDSDAYCGLLGSQATKILKLSLRMGDGRRVGLVGAMAQPFGLVAEASA
jgi:hypothetical protein